MTLQKKIPQPPPEAESMTIDISEEVEDEINELAEDTNETGKESEEIETAEVSWNRLMIGWLINDLLMIGWLMIGCIKIEIQLKDFLSSMFRMRMPNEIILMTHRILK